MNEISDSAVARFLYEVKRHCDYSLRAFSQLKVLIPALEEADPCSPGVSSMNLEQDELHLDIFRCIYSMLNHATNVCHLLWPNDSWKESRKRNSSKKGSRKRLAGFKEMRGKALRERLDVLPEEPSIMGRKLRNALVHFDERLDKWARSGTEFGVVADAIIPSDAKIDFSNASIHRVFNRAKLEFHLFEDTFELPALADKLMLLRG